MIFMIYIRDEKFAKHFCRSTSIAVEKLILTNLVACKIEMKICTFHVDCHKQRR